MGSCSRVCFVLLCLPGPIYLHAAASLRPRSTQNSEWVDPLIGTLNGGNKYSNTQDMHNANHEKGHVFPGATLPFGMAKAVADVNTELQGGFASDDGESQ